MVAFLIIVIGLIIWSLRLMQGAIKLRDFSLILASALVAVSAGGVVVVYMLMDGCMSYFTTVHAALPLEDAAQLVPSILYESDVTVSANVSALSEPITRILKN